MTPISHAMLIDKGITLANQLNQFLAVDHEANPTKKWNHKFLFLALLGYAASMARFSELDKDDFMQLAEGFFDNIVLTPTNPPENAA